MRALCGGEDQSTNLFHCRTIVIKQLQNRSFVDHTETQGGTRMINSNMTYAYVSEAFVVKIMRLGVRYCNRNNSPLICDLLQITQNQQSVDMPCIRNYRNCPISHCSHTSDFFVLSNDANIWNEMISSKHYNSSLANTYSHGTAINSSAAGDRMLRLWGLIPCLLIQWLLKSPGHQ